MEARILIMLTIVFILDFYIFNALRTSMAGFSTSTQKWITIIYWSISLIAYVMAILMFLNVFKGEHNFMVVYGRTFIMIFIFSKLFCLPILFIDDIRRIILLLINNFSVEKQFDASRSKFLTNTALILGAIPAGLLSYGAIRNPYRYRVERQDILIDDLSPDLEGFKIVQISDIHSGSFVFAEPILNAVELINKELADLVVFTGDIVNYKAEEMEGFFDIFSKIKPQSGSVISVLGNHDYGDYGKWDDPEKKAANHQQVIKIHERLGWDLLLDSHRIVQRGNTSLGVVGVENISALPYFPRYGSMTKAMQDMPQTDFKLLLSHDPSHWEMEVNTKYQDINLMLSGHTHGFQFGIEIPGFLQWSPSQYVYKQWGGLYQKGKQYLYVNRGFGFLGYAGRVGILPEISVFTLKRSV